MKISRFHRTSTAFTLVELLVVISIISILASLSFSGIKTAMEGAKKTSAKSDMQNIASAIKLYYTEYGRYPVAPIADGNDRDYVYGYGTKGNELIVNVLRLPAGWVEPVPTAPLNPRLIKFIEPKVNNSTKPLSCVSSNTEPSRLGKWFDPWGSQYIIFIDGDYNSDIDATACLTNAGEESTSRKIPVSVGVASNGLYNEKKKIITPTAALDFTTTDVKKNVLISWQ